MASLSERQGLLGLRLAKHLLRRGTYNIQKSRIESFASMTAGQAVDALFIIPPFTHPEGPLNYADGGTPWLTTGPYANNPGAASKQRAAVWFWFGNELRTDVSIRHKMAIFWHSIFTTGIDVDWKTFDIFRLFQYFALGNIKTLAEKVTLDHKMLAYLGNNLNSKGSPNENYAREFLELFTILKGPQIGPANYTNYTEHDVVQAARVLSGIIDAGFDNKDPDTGLATGQMRIDRHDIGNKQFSAAFNYQTIEGALDAAGMYDELRAFLNMVFGKKETAKAYVRRLYRFFVSDRIGQEVEQDIISPLADQLYNDGYEVENTVKILLKSQHFYDEDDSDATNEIIGGKIKSPLELMFQSVTFFKADAGFVLNSNPLHYDEFPRNFNDKTLELMGWEWYPASVEGYPGFFKEPNYSKFWYDQASIVSRANLPEALYRGSTLETAVLPIPFKIDLVTFVDQNFSNADYSDQVVQQFLELLLCEMPDAQRFAYFEEKLLASVSPINWAFDWLEYKKTGDKSSVEVALQNLVEAIIISPEYQVF